MQWREAGGGDEVKLFFVRFWQIFFEKSFNVFQHIVVWLGSWLIAFITDAIPMVILKNVGRFKFTAAQAHYPPCLVKFGLE